MRLTKIDCAKIAKQILQKKNDEFDIKMEELKSDLLDHFIREIPKDIFKDYNQNPEYFTNINFNLNINKRSFRINCPSKKGTSYYTITDTSTSLLLKHKSLEELFSKIKQSEISLVEHLYKLRTFEKVLIQFPDVTIEQKPKTTDVSLITPELLDWIKK